MAWHVIAGLLTFEGVSVRYEPVNPQQSFLENGQKSFSLGYDVLEFQVLRKLARIEFLNSSCMYM